MLRKIATRLSSTAKKPVVIASNRGRHSSKRVKLEEWCISMTPLEHSFRLNSPCKACPHTCPHGGDTLRCRAVLCSQWFCRGLAASQHPRLRSVLWLARRLSWWTPCSPKTSLIAHKKLVRHEVKDVLLYADHASKVP